MLKMISTELKKQLKKDYPFRIEMHAHTKPVSWCSEILPEEMAQTYRGKGYDAVCITNHFIGGDYLGEGTKEEKIKRYLAGYEETAKCGEKYNLKVYLGVEIRFQNENINDYLIFGADKDTVSECYDYLEGTLCEFRKNVNLDRSVFVQAHPFRDAMELANPELLDGIEIFNMHPGHNGRLGFAARYAKEKGLKINTVGSDFHHKNRGHEGVSALRTRTLPKDSFELAEILKSGDYLFEIGENSIVLP